jgi:hypothetical protein
MQTKIGFDKFPVPSILTEVPLNDIVTGEKLVDQGGIPLVTEVQKSVAEVARSDRATSVVFDSKTISPVPVVEIFRETSETSTTLLGIDRAETQLSLFSDVSVLGLDEDNWEVYNFTDYLRYGPWDFRGTKLFGNHYDASMSEETQEQAIRIGAFPVPYTFPWPSRFADQGLYNQTLYQQFQSFIELGNVLYTYFSESSRQQEYGVTFKDKFLDPTKVTISSNELTYTGVSEAAGLVLIDEWTRTWVDINSNLLLDPRNGITPITAAQINVITGSSPAMADTRPGYRTNDIRYSFMQSRKAFRYQPGRISGFTFGAKTSTDSGSEANVLEWGISNPTDQYTFQVKGASFSIVRRSTVPLEPAVIQRNGLDPLTGQVLEENGDPFDVDPATGQLRKYYTMTIARDIFNGDPVNGNGPSGYLLNPALVTMYKIEFGWYGAIGARFFAYVPIENGEGRWINLHTIVIENSLGKPCLEDPYFRFRYAVRINDASTLRTPQFIYKYGASMYIDGGDLGTVTQHSYNAPVRSINANNEKSLIGIYAKTEIINKEGVSKFNKKTILPKEVSVTSDVLAKIKVVKCRACPGFGHHFNQGLQTGTNGRQLNIKFVSSSRNRIATVPDNPLNPDPTQLFQLSDVGAKIIGDGLWSGYVGELDTDSAVVDNNQAIIGYEEAAVDRITNQYQKVSNSGYPAQVVPKATGQLLTVPINSTYPYPVRLSNYDAVAGSAVVLSGSKIQIQFLNPIPVGNLEHFNEFLIGVTDKKPVEVVDGGDVVLKWQYSVGDERTTLDRTDMLVGEWTQSTTRRDRNGYERGETNYPREYKMELDYRIPNPPGADSGACSVVTIDVLDRSQLASTLVSGNPETEAQDGFWYIKLQPNVQFPAGSLLGGEIGVNNVGSGVTFTSEQLSYQDGVSRIYYARISGQLAGVNAGATVTIQLTPVQLTAKHISTNKIFKFNPFPLYLVAMMKDGSRIHSISVAEQIGELTVSSSPKWISNGLAVIDNVSGLAAADLPPVNFVSQNRLDSGAIDTQLEQRLRPTSTLDTFFVGAGESARISLQNIYGPDRENITTDLLNTEATFFVGSVIPVAGQPTTGSIQISLNTAEQ